MSYFEGCYVKTAGDSAFWLIEGGKRRLIENVEDMYKHGLRRVVVIGEDELDAYPLAGEAGGDEEE